MNNRKRILVFVCLFLVLLMNDPSLMSFLQTTVPGLSSWVRPLASGFGLDNRWEMFSKAPRVYSRVVISKPLEGMPSAHFPRTPAESLSASEWSLFTFRDEKYFLNLFNHRDRISTYLWWWCLHQRGEPKAESLRFEYLENYLIQRSDAVRFNRTMIPWPNRSVMEVSCIR